MDQERLHLEFATITRGRVFTEDHGIKTFFLDLSYEGGGSCQGAGGYALDGFNKSIGKRVMNKQAMEIVPFINRMFSVKDWKYLAGKWVYVIHNSRCVKAIGRYSSEWLDFPEFFGDGKRDLMYFDEVVRRYPHIDFQGCLIRPGAGKGD